MGNDFVETGSVTLPYMCECGIAHRHAISAAMCCSPLNDPDDLDY